MIISRIAEAYWQSKFALVGISREWEPRGRLANGNCNHSNLTQSSSRQGRWASALRPMLIGTMGGRFRAKGGSPFACLPSLIGVASERYARRPPIGEVAQSPSHQSPYASAVRPKLVSAIGNGYRPYGRSPFPSRTSLIGVASKVLRTFRSRLLIGEPESRWPTDAQPMLGVRSGHALQERMDEDADSRCAARVQGPV